MISTISELLEAFLDQERKILDEKEIKHAPTIGSMYEGLTRDILEKSLPEKNELHVVSGFIKNSIGEMSNQIDCMLVDGDGEKIPYTESFIYEIEKVIAIIEVKKNLYTREMIDAYHNLLSICRLIPRSNTNESMFVDAHRSILRIDPRFINNLMELPLWKRQISMALYDEFKLPLRITFGYHGFNSEFGFREAFVDFIEKNTGIHGFGALQLPNLIISEKYSLIKIDGMPYTIPVAIDYLDVFTEFGLYPPANPPPETKDLWVLYASYPENPITLLLELIWTRLIYKHKVDYDIIGEDPIIEILRPLILAKAILQEGNIGWYYHYILMDKGFLEHYPKVIEWKPVQLSPQQAGILSIVIKYEGNSKEGVSKNDPMIIGNEQELPSTIEDDIDYLERVCLISVDGDVLRSLTDECMIATYDGQIFAGENRAHQFTNWLVNKIK